MLALQVRKANWLAQPLLIPPHTAFTSRPPWSQEEHP